MQADHGGYTCISYNFLHTPAPALGTDPSGQRSQNPGDGVGQSQDMIETDNGYFAIFDGHAGTFAADWCGKKLHIVLEDIIRKNPNSPIPELLDQTFTTVDAQLEKLPLKNSGCTAAIAVLRWEDRCRRASPTATGSQAIAPAQVARAAEEAAKLKDAESSESASSTEAAHAKLKTAATRQRVLYTANGRRRAHRTLPGGARHCACHMTTRAATRPRGQEDSQRGRPDPQQSCERRACRDPGAGGRIHEGPCHGSTPTPRKK